MIIAGIAHRASRIAHCISSRHLVRHCALPLLTGVTRHLSLSRITRGNFQRIETSSLAKEKERDEQERNLANVTSIPRNDIR